MMAMFSDVAVIVPAFNEGNRVIETLEELKKFFSKVFVVDDGSTDNTFELLKSSWATVLQHPINLGQGAALQTGIEAALSNKDIKFILTFDADGQHSVKDAVRFAETIKSSGIQIILGSRFINSKNLSMPRKKKLILRLGIIFTRFDSGLQVTDTHNGLRIMSRNFAESLKLRQSGMAHASEILRHIKNSKSTWIEIPAEINYTPYSIKKGQSIFNAVNILTEMMHK